jgi:hypothetical protein
MPPNFARTDLRKEASVQELRGIAVEFIFETQQNRRSHPAMSTSIVSKLASGALEEIWSDRSQQRDKSSRTRIHGAPRPG